MPLAERALIAITGIPVQLTCHASVWFWAAQEATAQRLTTQKTAIVRAGNITGLPGGPQNAMLALPRTGLWNFTGPNYATPPQGSVLLWTASPTHSAIVTADGIAGYNQMCVFAPFINTAGHSVGHPSQLNANSRTCHYISAATIVQAAATHNL